MQKSGKTVLPKICSVYKQKLLVGYNAQLNLKKVTYGYLPSATGTN